MRIRMRVTMVCAFLGLSAIGVRLHGLQVEHAEWYEKLARKQHLRQISLHAHRGTITDRHGNVLALSVDRLSLFANPARIEDPAGTAARIAPVLGQPADRIERRLQRNGYFVWLARKLEPAMVGRIRKLGIAGLGFREEVKRVYPNGRLACHVLGFSGTDNNGLEGVESKYDLALSGKTGKHWVFRDGRPSGPVQRHPELEERRPTDGRGVVLTLDLWIQHIVEEALDELIEKHAPKAAVGIVLESRTGEILALAGRPSFDPNTFSESQRKTYRCRAVTDLYEMGSTIKPFVAAGALAEGRAQLEEQIFCENGAWKLAGRTLHDHRPFGELTVREVVEKSSNIGIAKLAARLGPRALHGYLTAFGFGRSTKVGLPGEEKGVLRNWKGWSESTMASIPMGHEMSATPIQLAVAFNVLATGGMHVAPRILLRMIESGGATTHRFGTMQTSRVLPQALVEESIAPMLRGVVERGTGRRAAVNGLTVAGKTGTAQKIDTDTGRYSHTKHLVSFVGYAPADSTPSGSRITVLVLADEPTRNAAGGGRVAAPVFARIVDRIVAMGRMP